MKIRVQVPPDDSMMQSVTAVEFEGENARVSEDPNGDLDILDGDRLMARFKHGEWRWMTIDN